MNPQNLELDLKFIKLESECCESLSGDMAAKNETSMKKLLSTSNTLYELKEQLNRLIEFRKKNESILTIVSRHWNRLPIWAQILLGISLVIPLLMIGIFAHIAVLIALSIFVAVVYIPLSLALNNHHAHHEDNEESLKTTILSMAELLGAMIEQLEDFIQDLAQQLDVFYKENLRLNHEISELGSCNSVLNETIKRLSATEQALYSAKTTLEQNILELQTTSDVQALHYETAIQQLEQVQSDYDDNQKQLVQARIELQELTKKMQQERQRATDNIDNLRSAVLILSNLTTKDDDQKAVFFKKLEAYCEHNQAHLLSMNAQLEFDNTKITQITSHFEGMVQEFQEVCNQQVQCLERLQKLQPLDKSESTLDGPVKEHKSNPYQFYSIKADEHPDDFLENLDSDFSSISHMIK